MREVKEIYFEISGKLSDLYINGHISDEDHTLLMKNLDKLMQLAAFPN